MSLSNAPRTKLLGRGNGGSDCWGQSNTTFINTRPKRSHMVHPAIRLLQFLSLLLIFIACVTIEM
jgi:hypothetical protein